MPFKHQINQVYRALEELKSSSAQMRRISLENPNNYNIHIGEGKGDGIVLKSDIFLELGGPFADSVALTLQTNDEHLVKEDSITLIGDDIHEADRPILFGQIILVSGELLNDEDYLKIARVHNKNGYIEGHMVKSSENNIWVRVSKNLGNRGFSFDCYGSAIIAMVKTMTPSVKNVAVIFITSAKEHLQPFQNLAVETKKITQKIKEDKWLTKGINIYDCAFHGNCSSCSDKETCNEIQKMTKQRKTPNKR